MATEDYRRIFETLRMPVAGADRAGAVAFANAAFAELAGRREPLAGRELASLFAGGDRRRVQQNLARVAEGKAASAYLEAELAREDGSTRWVSVALQPWLDGRGEASGAVAVVQDIGAQRESEEALNLSVARLLAIAEASPAPLMVETAAGEVELANEAFCRSLALDSAPQSLSGLPVAEALARSRDPAARAALERRPIVVDGRERGAVWAAAGAEARGPAKAAAEIALIERIALELSVALEGLATLSVRAQRSELDPSVVEHLQRIRAATETAVAAIGDMVDFSKLSGGVVLQPGEFGLRAALADLVARVMPAVEERGARLRLKVEQDVSDRLVGDVERLQLVLKNLLDTTLAVAPGAEVSLQITPEYTTEAGIELSFSVSAAGGRGGAPAPRLSPEGGMGIAVAKFMVAAMGGRLAIAPRAGEGEPLYAFTIRFPVRPAPAPPPRPVFASLVGLPVLLVSGDPAQRSSLAGLLRRWRMLPLEADNASMALTLLERLHQEGTPVPLVILANQLPVQDGFLLAFRIRNHPGFASTIVMMLATGGRPGDAIACRENGIAAYMRYPIGDHQLHEAIVAVTGAAADVSEAPTLVTRHSLRETRKGATVLVVDASRDIQIQAAHILGREDASVVVAHDLLEAFTSLEQDTYDLVLVDSDLGGISPAQALEGLRSRIDRGRAATRIVAMAAAHTDELRASRLAEGFDATLAKPFRREELLQLVARGEAAAAEPG